MPGQFTIELKNLRFFAEHGLYAEEALLGNEFEVDISIRKHAPDTIVSSVDQTVDYVEVFRIVQEEFSKRKPLLETCAMTIAARIRDAFQDLKTISVSVRKLHPPIINFIGSVGINYTEEIK